MTSTEEWDARFERDGETAVRDSLAAGSYLEDTAKLAREWLHRRDQAASEAVELNEVASNLEQIRIARAAWMAATAAIIAGICAVIVSLHK
jgi:hypothetical protein